jgi:hypothetical protein
LRKLVAFSAIKSNSDAGVADLLSGLDDKLAILKGLIGALPHSDSVVAELGVDVFSILDGLAGTVHHSKSVLNQSLKEMQVQLATSATRVEGLPVRIEKVESTLTQGGELLRVLSALVSRLDMLEGTGFWTSTFGSEEEPAIGIRRLEICLRRVEEQEALEEKTHEKIPASLWESGVQESIVERLTHLETVSNDVDDGFELGGQTVNCLEDCHDWLVLKGPGSEYLGHWIDPFSTSSYADTHGTTANQTLVNKSTLKKAALDNDQVSAIILISFADDHPSMVGSSNLVTDTSVLLPKVKTFSNWYLEGAIGKFRVLLFEDGCRPPVEELAPDVEKAIQADLRSVAQEFSVMMSAALGGGGPNEPRGVSQKVFDTFVRKDYEPMAKRLKAFEDRS